MDDLGEKLLLFIVIGTAGVFVGIVVAALTVSALEALL